MKVKPVDFLKTGDIILARHHVKTDTAFGKMWDAVFKQDPLGWFVSRYPLTVNVHNNFYPAHGGLYIASKQNDEATGLTWEQVCEWARSKKHLHVTKSKFEKRGMIMSSGPKDLATLFGKTDPGAGVQAWNMPEFLEVDKDGLYTYESSQGKRDLMFLRATRPSDGFAVAVPVTNGWYVHILKIAKNALGFLGLGYDVPQMGGVVTLALAGRLDKKNPFDPKNKLNCAEVATDAYKEADFDFEVVHPQIAGRSLKWWLWTPNWVKRALMKLAKKRAVHPSNLTLIALLLESPVLKEVRHESR